MRQVFSTVGLEGDPLRSNLRIRTTKKHERERGLQAIKTDMRQRLTAIPMLKMTVADPEFMQGAPSEAPLNVFVRGDDMEALQRLNDEIVTRIKAVPGAVDVDSSLESGQPEMVAEVNRAFAADMGFDVASVATQLRAWSKASCRRASVEGDKEYDIRVRLAPEFRNDFQTIAPHTALFAARRTRPHGRHRPDGVRASVRPTSSARPGDARPRSASSSTAAPLGDVTATSRVVMAGIAHAAELRVGLCRRRRADAGVRRGDGAGAAAGGRLHLHRAGVAVRVVPRTVPDHAVAAARHRRRAAGRFC